MPYVICTSYEVPRTDISTDIFCVEIPYLHIYKCCVLFARCGNLITRRFELDSIVPERCAKLSTRRCVYKSSFCFVAPGVPAVGPVPLRTGSATCRRIIWLGLCCVGSCKRLR